MKKLFTICAAVLCLTAALTPAAMAAETPEVQVCYPTSVTQSEDGSEIRKIYDLSPEDDPLGISRSDFEQDGYHYTLTDLLKQELRSMRSASTRRQSRSKVTKRIWSPCWPCCPRKRSL